MSTGQLPTSPPAGQPAPGSLSPDRLWYWNAGQWSPALSPDGRWLWNGSAWEPAASVQFGVTPYESARVRATFVVVAFAGFGVGLIVWTAGDLMAIGALASSDVTGVLQGLGGVILLLAYLLCIVSFCLWIHRATRNLPALGKTYLPRFTPRWAVGWFFVPILNLVRPYQVMREIWRGSFVPARGWGLVKWWWALWLISNYLDNIVTRNWPGVSGDALNAFGNVVDGSAVVLAVLVVLRITAAQARLAQGTAPPHASG